MNHLDMQNKDGYWIDNVHAYNVSVCISLQIIIYTMTMYKADFKYHKRTCRLPLFLFSTTKECQFECLDFLHTQPKSNANMWAHDRSISTRHALIHKRLSESVNFLSLI